MAAAKGKTAGYRGLKELIGYLFFSLSIYR
jgi:hypothetical protein